MLKLKENIDQLAEQATTLLQKLISTPSLSREEDRTASLLESYWQSNGFEPLRSGNNVWVKSQNFDSNKPTVLLNSHHDTVKPTTSWTRNPYEASIESDKLYGLGSNDAGGALVGLITAFNYMARQISPPFNLIMAATAEEEISGSNGVASILQELGDIAVGIVGEPTHGDMAIAEKGLMVLDCEAVGESGHAARNEGINAIDLAIRDIEWLQSYKFEQDSDLLGPVKLTVTQIVAGTQHNVIPDRCEFVVDVRTNECYGNQEVLDIIRGHLKSAIKPRSLRLNSSKISLRHPLVERGLDLGLQYYGSPTLSDQALMSFPTLKIGPGDSARSHTADEFIYLEEIQAGILTYINLLTDLKI